MTPMDNSAGSIQLEALPPLLHAEAAYQQAVAAEALAQQRYQQVRLAWRTSLAELRQLRSQENAARSQAARVPLRAACCFHEAVAAEEQAALEEADILRREANQAMVAAQRAHTEVLQQARLAWRRWQMALANHAEYTAEDAALAFAELAGLIGADEAEQLQAPGAKPGWLGRQ